MAQSPLDPRSLDTRSTALLLLLVTSVLLLRLGAVPLLGPDEPRYVRVAIEMRRSGDFVTPTLGGDPWLEKPVLYYWLCSASTALFGETEFAARVPSALAAVLLVMGTALFGARLLGRASGTHAGFMLATSVLVFAFGRAATMDMLLASFVTLATGFLGLFVLGIAGRLALEAAWVFMALATLAKGPVGTLLPLLVLAAYALLTRSWEPLLKTLSATGAVLYLLVAVPWYALEFQAQGRAFVDVFLLNHNLARFTSTVHHHPGSFAYYLPILAGGVFPWSGLALPAFARLSPRRSASDGFLLSWLLAPLAFFSAAGSKLPGYILPCLPPLILLMGRAASRLARREDLPPWAGRRLVGLVGLALGTALASSPWLLRHMGDPGWPLLLPAAAWTLVFCFLAYRWLPRDEAGALRVLRVGGAGLLVLLTLGAPPILAREQSGASLFRHTGGREVLVWGAWRTAWMSGYFYNDGHVREVEGPRAILEAARRGPVLVLAGPQERRRIEAMPEVLEMVLATDVRGDALLEARLP